MWEYLIFGFLMVVVLLTCGLIILLIISEIYDLIFKIRSEREFRKRQNRYKKMI